MGSVVLRKYYLVFDQSQLQVNNADIFPKFGIAKKNLQIFDLEKALKD